MSTARPVVVYAASGYTGRLVCRALARLGIPFVAAGRNPTRLDALVRELLAEGAQCEARTAAHTPTGLKSLFHGAQVVVNTSGPFSLLGRAVVEAALAQGCHYVDTTGEQDFMLSIRHELGAAFARERLLLAPSAAFLWALGTAAAEVCLETSGVERLQVVYAPPSLQTVASLQSMVRTVRRPGYAIVERALCRLPAGRMRPTPLQQGAVSVGAGEAVFFIGDPRVHACETLFASAELVRALPLFRLWSHLGRVVPGGVLDTLSDALVHKLKKEPPSEDPHSGRFVVVAVGEGSDTRVRVTLRGTSPYKVTGFLCAMAAENLLAERSRCFGYASLAQAFGARPVLQRLEEMGTAMTVEKEERHAAA